MTYLLDVNVLVALGLTTHQFHPADARWSMSLDASKTVFATCSITEIGFVRVLAHTPQYRLSVADARSLLQKVKATFPIPFEFIPDDHGASDWPAWVRTPKQVGDGHLARLAESKGAEFVALDRGIPGALLIPLHG